MKSTGKVKFFNAEKGYGFITQDNGKTDIFFHVSEMEKAGLNSLVPGQSIEYIDSVDVRSKKPRATDLALI